MTVYLCIGYCHILLLNSICILYISYIMNLLDFDPNQIFQAFFGGGQGPGGFSFSSGGSGGGEYVLFLCLGNLTPLTLIGSTLYHVV